MKRAVRGVLYTFYPPLAVFSTNIPFNVLFKNKKERKKEKKKKKEGYMIIIVTK